MATAADGSELRRRGGKKGTDKTELLSQSKITKEKLQQADVIDNEEKKDKIKENDTKQKDQDNNDGYDAAFWYELKYTVVRCVLLIVIFFILNHIFNTYFLDPFFGRGDIFKQRQRQRKLNDIRSRVCPHGAMDCNVDLSHLDNII